MTQRMEVVAAPPRGPAARVVAAAAEGASPGTQGCQVAAAQPAPAWGRAGSKVGAFPCQAAGPRKPTSSAGSGDSAQDHHRSLPRRTSGRLGPSHTPRSLRRPALSQRQQDLSGRACLTHLMLLTRTPSNMYGSPGLLVHSPELGPRRGGYAGAGAMPSGVTRKGRGVMG